jgi:N-acetylglucosamine-6-sulfatase
MKKLSIVLLLFVITKLLSAAEKPNIIFILIDDQRYDFLSYLDHPWIKTPHIDKLAANGMYFDNAFVTTSLCSPSRASIITGQYAHTHGVMDNETPLPPNNPNFGVELQKAGYNTGFVGKWHMGGVNDMPRPGFDHWVSFKGQGPYMNPDMNVNGEQVKREGYTTDILTDFAVDFIKRKVNEKEPYFLYLSHKAIHEDFTPAPRHKGAYNGLIIPRPVTFDESAASFEGKPDWLKKQRNSWHGAERDFYDMPYGNFDNFYRLYSEAMLAVDESIGRVAETLNDLGELENTVIIYYSDNGYLIGEHGLIDKRVMYEPSIRVPAFVHWPEVVKTPVHKKELVTNIDIGPTILDMAGAEIPEEMHGESFLPIVKNEPVDWRDAFIYEYYCDPYAVQTPTIIGLRTDNYSYMTYKGVWDNYELYDIQKDPDQIHNLLGHIVYGQTYGTFLQKVWQQDKEIWPLIKELDDKLNKLWQEKDGEGIPNRTKQ